MTAARRSVLLAALAAVALARAAWAQGSITLTTGSTASAQIPPAGHIIVPVIVDMSQAGGANVAALSARVRWSGPMILDSIRAAGFGTLTSNFGDGDAIIAVYNAVGATTTTTIANLFFRARPETGGTQVSVTPLSAGNQSGASILSLFTQRDMDVCVAPLAPWGDANGDGAVNIIDAQQIARFSVGLSVANSQATSAQGDVTADGTVNILDAQQIARFSVALTAAARLGTSLSIVPPVSSIYMTPDADGLGIGQQLQLIATTLDASESSLTGCGPLTWASSDVTKATVNASGLVTGVATGTATITATTPNGLVGSALITVFVPVASVAFARDTATIHMGEQFQLTATAYDAGGAGGGGGSALRARSSTATAPLPGRTIEYYSSDPSVATVSPSGLVTSYTVGRVTITAMSEGKSAVATMQVSPTAENSLAIGEQHACALTVAGIAYCWGQNGAWQLGDGSGASSAIPVRVSAPPGLIFTQITAGGSGTCAVSTGQSVYCWGSGILGLNSQTPVLVSNTLHIRSVSSGNGFACGIDLAGAAYCAGQGASGRLGNGTTTSSVVPVPVSGGLTFQSVGASVLSACGLLTNGAAYCWGDNSVRTLGIAGLPANSLVPGPVTGGLVFTNLRAGGLLTCGVVPGGAGYCWGADFAFGSNGAGPPGTLSNLPTAIVGGVSFRTVVPGIGNNILDSTCGLATDGTAYCWGPNRSGQLGTTATLPNTCTFSASPIPCTGTPTAVTTAEKFSVIATGSELACGITLTRALLCWGRNESGQVGDGTTTNKSTPTAVVGGLRWP
jgi:alpha-tubulin suppressor-like RCC1 family protein